MTATDDEPATDPQDDAPVEAQDVPDDPRARFRAALERKNARHADAPTAPGQGGSHLKRSSDKTQRQFRRKSG